MGGINQTADIREQTKPASFWFPCFHNKNICACFLSFFFDAGRKRVILEVLACGKLYFFLFFTSANNFVLQSFVSGACTGRSSSNTADLLKWPVFLKSYI